MASKDNTIQIPVIDISPHNVEAPKQLLAAARDFGFIFISNDNEAGIPPDLIAQQFEISKDFFSLPTEIKEQVSIASNKAGKNHGWLSQGVEKLDPKTQKSPDVKEAFNLSLPTPDKTFDQPLPPPILSHLSSVINFELACHNLCQKILSVFALALEIPENWFTSRHDPSQGPLGSIFRYLYYPARKTTTSEIDLRAGAHSDYGSITCLFQLPGQPGLEIQRGKEWVRVPVDPLQRGGALPILVNIGDLLEDWTGGLLKSTVHRVVFPEGEADAGDRYSIAYFCHPLDEALLEPVPSRIVREFAEKNGTRSGREGVTARDHLMERLAATYKIE